MRSHEGQMQLKSIHSATFGTLVFIHDTKHIVSQDQCCHCSRGLREIIRAGSWYNL